MHHWRHIAEFARPPILYNVFYSRKTLAASVAYLIWLTVVSFTDKFLSMSISSTSISVVERILCSCMTCQVPMVSSVVPMGIVAPLSVSAKTWADLACTGCHSQNAGAAASTVANVWVHSEGFSSISPPVVWSDSSRYQSFPCQILLQKFSFSIWA